MQDLIANLRQLLEPGAVLTGEQIGDKYSVDYTAENPHAPLAETFASGIVVDAIVAQSEAQREAVWSICGGIAEIARLLTPYASLDVRLELERMQALLFSSSSTRRHPKRPELEPRR